jgi:hypothetical protein
MLISFFLKFFLFFISFHFFSLGGGYYVIYLGMILNTKRLSRGNGAFFFLLILLDTSSALYLLHFILSFFSLFLINLNLLLLLLFTPFLFFSFGMSPFEAHVIRGGFCTQVKKIKMLRLVGLVG